MEHQPEKVGRYAVLSTVGRGAMGVVYRAKDPLIGRTVAIKTVTLSGLLSSEQLEEFKARFFREAQSAGILHHPNIVTIHDVGEQDGMPFMAMELVEGTSLNRRIKERGRLSAPEAVDVVKQVAKGLAFAHAKGIVHRDIKPDNILLEEGTGRAVVADFGVAHVTTSELTRTGEVLGTPYFMSPEQVLGNPLDGRSDLFSLGVVFYLALSGRRPFKGDTVSSVCYHIVHGQVEPLPPDVHIPPNLAPVLSRMLAKDPALRYPDGDALVKALEGAMAGTREVSAPGGDSTLDLASSPVAGMPLTTAQTAARVPGYGTAAPRPPSGQYPAGVPQTPSGSYPTGMPQSPSGSYPTGMPQTPSGQYPTGVPMARSGSMTGQGTLSGTAMGTLAAATETPHSRGLLFAVLALLGLVVVVVAFIFGVVLASGGSKNPGPASPAGQQQPSGQDPSAPPGEIPSGTKGKEPTRPGKEPGKGKGAVTPQSCPLTVVFETRIAAGRLRLLVDGQEHLDVPFQARRGADGRAGYRATQTLDLPPGRVELKAIVSGGRGDAFSLEGSRTLELKAGQGLSVNVGARRFPPPQVSIEVAGN